MRKILALAMASVVVSIPAVQAQAPSGPAAEVQGSFKRVQKNVLEAAEKMPADQYGYRPHAEQRTFARVVNHVTEAQANSCGSVLKLAPADRPKAPAETASKAEVIAALKASFAVCDKAYATVTDANLAEKVTNPRGARSLIGVLWGNVGHDMEQYAILSDYLRDKNLVPPTSEK